MPQSGDLLNLLLNCDPQSICPPVRECPPPQAWTVDIDIPDSWIGQESLFLKITPSWSPSEKALCAHLEGYATRGTQVSDTVQLSTPLDCVIVPEASILSMLFAGIILLALVRRRH